MAIDPNLLRQIQQLIAGGGIQELMQAIGVGGVGGAQRGFAQPGRNVRPQPPRRPIVPPGQNAAPTYRIQPYPYDGAQPAATPVPPQRLPIRQPAPLPYQPPEAAPVPPVRSPIPPQSTTQPPPTVQAPQLPALDQYVNTDFNKQPTKRRLPVEPRY